MLLLLSGSMFIREPLEHRRLQVQMQPARAKLLYERALALFPVTVYLWQQYVSYLQEQGTPASVVSNVYSRQELDAGNSIKTGGCLAALKVPTTVNPACMSGQDVHLQHQLCKIAAYLSAVIYLSSETSFIVVVQSAAQLPLGGRPVGWGDEGNGAERC